MLARIRSPAHRLALCVALLIAASVSAEVPETMRMRALVLDTQDQRLDATLGAVSVGLWSAETGGTLLYLETFFDVVVAGGRLSLELGTGALDPDSPFDRVADAVLAGATAMELTIDGEAQVPRGLLGTSPFAIRALHGLDADSVDGIGASALQRVLAAPCPEGSTLRAVAPDGQVVCEPDDGGALAPGGGIVLDGTTLAVDREVAQARIATGCAPGSFLRGVDGEGRPECAADADEDTVYDAGPGLELLGTTVSIDATTVQRRIAGTCPPGSAVRRVGETGSVSCWAIAAGDITAVTAGAGLRGGCTSGTCALGTDPAATQARVDGTCGPGTAVRSIAVSGSVTCAPVFDGDITSVVPGNGISATCAGGSCALAVDTSYSQQRVTTQCPAGQVMSAVGQSGTATCRAVGIGDITGIGTASGSGLDGGCLSGTCSLAADPDDFMVAPARTFNDFTRKVDAFTVQPETLASRTLTAPASTGGTVVAIASGDMECDGNCATSLFSTLTTDLALPATAGKYSEVTADNIQFGLFLHDTFPVGAGESVTVYWRAGILPGPAVNVHGATLSLVFIPH